MRKSFRSSTLANLFVLIATLVPLSAAGAAQGRLTCRGQSADYGLVAFTLIPDPYLKGKIIVRNCGLVGEIAGQFGTRKRPYDTYIIEGFSQLNCQVTDGEVTGTQVHSCSIDNPMLAESMNDDIGVQFRQVIRWGELSYIEIGAGKAEVSYTLRAPKHPLYTKTVLLADFACSAQEIGAEEGVCQP